MSEKQIEELVSIANREIALGYPAPVALAALETGLVLAWEATDVPAMLALLRDASLGTDCMHMNLDAPCGKCWGCRRRALLDKHGRG